MLAKDVLAHLPRRGVVLDQLVDDQILKRMMSSVGIMGHVVHDIAHEVEICRLHLMHVVQLLVENVEHMGDILVVAVELIHDVHPVFLPAASGDRFQIKRY